MSGIELELSSVSSWLIDAGYSIEDEARIYELILDDLGENPRWYLDNLEYLAEIRLRWVDYTRQYTPSIPRKFVKNQKLYK